MTAVKPADVDAFVARPDPKRPVVLVFGPDAGLVSERVNTLVKAAVDDVSDPFALARLDGEELAAEPSRLVEEAQTIPLFGGRRAVWVKAASRNIAGAVEALLALPAFECRVVIEAGDLRRNAPLRSLIERAKNAAALPCYADNEKDRERLIDDEMRAAGLKLAPDARALLVPLLGGDRQASRNELRKLVLYAHGQGEVTLDHVKAIVSDASDLTLDPIVDGAFAGKPDLVETEFAKAMIAGTYPGLIISAALRHATWLHKSALAIAEGMPASAVIDGGFPRLHFSRKPAAETALRNFSPARLLGIVDQLGTAALDTRKQPSLAAAIAQRTMLSIAVNARRRG